jgi:hypothetical protein
MTSNSEFAIARSNFELRELSDMPQTNWLIRLVIAKGKVAHALTYINIKIRRSTDLYFLLEYLLRSGICFSGKIAGCEGR